MAVALASRSPGASRSLTLKALERSHARRKVVAGAQAQAVQKVVTPGFAREVAAAFIRLRDSCIRGDTSELTDGRPPGVKAAESSGKTLTYVTPAYDEFEHAMTKTLTKEWLTIGGFALNSFQSQIGIQLEFDLHEQNIPKGIIARRVTQMSNDTKRRINDTIRQGIADGAHPSTIAKSLFQQMSQWAGAGDSPVSKSRAMVIARTETAFAYNIGSIQNYRKTGLVETVEVIDGPNCGWLHHNDPEHANGKVVTLDDAEAHPTSHPNCVRAFAPIVQEAGKVAAPPQAQASDLYANPKQFRGMFGSGSSDLEKWADQIYAEALAGGEVTTDMRYMLQRYSGSHYGTLNPVSRGLNLDRYGNVLSDAQRLQAERDIALLEKYLSLGKTPDAVVVHRGIGSGKWLGLETGYTIDEALAQLKTLVGEVVEEKGFMSTALSKDASFSGVQMELTVPKGYPGMPVSARTTSAAAYTTSPAMGEAELLFQKGAKIRIDRVETETEPGLYRSQRLKIYGTVLPR